MYYRFKRFVERLWNKIPVVAQRKTELWKAKMEFRAALEGSEWTTERGFLGGYPFSSLGVTNFRMSIRKGVRHVTVTLERPGILIGKSGSTINGVEKQMSQYMPTEIHIVESRLWS